jgi:hypothetical protein
MMDITPSESRKSITSPFAGGMNAAQLERALQRTPHITRFNRLRKRPQALRTPDSRTSKKAVAGDEVATTSKSTTAVHTPEILTGDGF